MAASFPTLRTPGIDIRKSAAETPTFLLLPCLVEPAERYPFIEPVDEAREPGFDDRVGERPRTGAGLHALARQRGHTTPYRYVSTQARQRITIERTSA